MTISKFFDVTPSEELPWITRMSASSSAPSASPAAVYTLQRAETGFFGDPTPGWLHAGGFFIARVEFEDPESEGLYSLSPTVRPETGQLNWYMGTQIYLNAPLAGGIPTTVELRGAAGLGVEFTEPGSIEGDAYEGGNAIVFLEDPPIGSEFVLAIYVPGAAAPKAEFWTDFVNATEHP